MTWQCRNISLEISSFETSIKSFYSIVRIVHNYSGLFNIILLLNVILLIISCQRAFTSIPSILIIIIEIFLSLVKWFIHLKSFPEDCKIEILENGQNDSGRACDLILKLNPYISGPFKDFICNYSTGFEFVEFEIKRTNRTVTLNIPEKYRSDNLILEVICGYYNINIREVTKGPSVNTYYIWQNDNYPGDCFINLKINYKKFFHQYYVNIYKYNTNENHIDVNRGQDAKKVFGFNAIILNHLYGLNKPFISVSVNKNPDLPPCLLSERLEYIDKYIPCTNKTAENLNKYLKYIAHLYHNKSTKKVFITKERKARWSNHVKWVVKSPAIGPVFANYEFKEEIVKSEDYKQQEEIFEVKTATKVDYIEGKDEEIVTKTEEEVSTHIFDFDFEIIRHHKKNMFVVEDKNTKRRSTRRIHPCLFPGNNPRNPFFLRDKEYFASVEPYKTLIEQNKIFYCEETGKYHTFYVNKKIEKVNVEKKHTPPVVKFTEVEYEVPVIEDNVVKFKTKKNHDLEWRKVSRKTFVEKIKEVKDVVTTHNRFSVLKPNVKLSKEMKVRPGNKYRMADAERSICKISFLQSKNHKTTIEKTKIEKPVKVGDKIEQALNAGISNKIREKLKTRLKYYKRNTYLDLETIIKAMEKGFLTKKDMKVKKCFRLVAMDYLDSLCCDEKISCKKSIGSRTGSWNKYSVPDDEYEFY